MKGIQYKVTAVFLALSLAGCGESMSSATSLPPNWDYYNENNDPYIVDFEEFIEVVEEDLKRIYTIEPVSNPRINESSVSEDGNEEEKQYYWVKAFYGTLLDMDDTLITVHPENSKDSYEYRVVNFDGEAMLEQIDADTPESEELMRDNSEL